MAGTVGRVFKWLGVGVGSALVLILLLAGYFYWKSGRMINRQFDYTVARAVYVPADSATVARGGHVAFSMTMCMDCHGEDLGGGKVIDQPEFAVIYAPNLTRGRGGLGVGAGYDVKLFDRAVRHGISRDGRGMYVMPSVHYSYLSDDDLAALYAYVTSLAPVDRETPPIKMGPIARMLLATGKLPPVWAEVIQHEAQRPARPAPAATREYGQYVARISCIGCHRPDLSGGVIEDGDPAWPPASNLTSVLKNYTYDDFRKVMTEGERPGGNPLAEPMARVVRYSGLMEDYELEALWLYFRSVNELPTGTASWFTARVP